MVKVTAGALEDQPTGCDIPQSNPAFYVGIKTAGSHIDHGECGGAHDTDLLDLVNKAVELRKHLFETGGGLCKTNGNDAFLQT